MCGRFTIAITAGLPERFLAVPPPEPIIPRYNIAPTQIVPVIVPGSGTHSAPREIVLMRWGLIPSFAKEPGTWSTINARSETATIRPAFRDALKDRRCLVPATGFYEWRKERGNKVPFYITRKDAELFAFAGLWDRWQPHGSPGPLLSFTILTRAAAPWMAHLHERMPVILQRQDEETWLRTGPLSGPELDTIYRAPPEDAMTIYEVSRAVNNLSRDDPALLQPVDSMGLVGREWDKSPE